jgi:hypothetical protein
MPTSLATRQERSPSAAAIGSLAGRVLDRDQRPIEGALVTAAAVEPRTIGIAAALPPAFVFLRGGANRPQDAKTLTDREGRYELLGLKAGRYVVAASRPGFVAEARGLSDPAAGYDVIEIGATRHVGSVDFALLRGARIVGRVVDGGGRPFTDAEVRVATSGDAGTAGPIPSAVADANGAYRIVDLPPGNFRVAATVLPPKTKQAAAAVASTIPEVTWYPGVRDQRDAALISIEAGATIEGIDIFVLRSERVSIAGHVVGHLGERVESSIRGASGTSIRRVTVGPDGSFTVPNLAPGRYILTARSQGKDATEAAWQAIDVSDDLSGLELPLMPTGEMSGRVVTETGAPLPTGGLRVAAVLMDGDDEADPLKEDQVELDAAGRFQIAGLYGTRELRVIGLPVSWWIGWIQHGREERTSFLLGPGATIENVTVILTTR